MGRGGCGLVLKMLISDLRYTLKMYIYSNVDGILEFQNSSSRILFCVCVCMCVWEKERQRATCFFMLYCINIFYKYIYNICTKYPEWGLRSSLSFHEDGLHYHAHYPSPDSINIIGQCLTGQTVIAGRLINQVIFDFRFLALLAVGGSLAGSALCFMNVCYAIALLSIL